jgi:hypothetical protein
MIFHYPSTTYLFHVSVHLLTIALSTIAIHWHHSPLLMNSNILCYLDGKTKIRICYLLVFRFSLTRKNKTIYLLWRMRRAHRGVCRLWTAQLLRMIKISTCCQCIEWWQDRRGLLCRECRVSMWLRSKATPQLVYTYSMFCRDEQLSTLNLFWIEVSWFRACQGRCRTRSKEPWSLIF